MKIYGERIRSHRDTRRKNAKRIIELERDGGGCGCGCDWTAGIPACHAAASKGVERLSFDEIEADIGRSGDVRQAGMPAVQSRSPFVLCTGIRILLHDCAPFPIICTALSSPD